MTTTKTEVHVQCDMNAECARPVAMIDTAGFAYCEPHGLQRRWNEPCRKLRPYELRKLFRGEQIERY